jgi:hypothetical protein
MKGRPPRVQMRAEIVVTFEGTTEFGNPFMARQSYTALEIHWGSRFRQIIYPPEEGDTQYTVDIKRCAINTETLTYDCTPMIGLRMLAFCFASKTDKQKTPHTCPYQPHGEQ